MRKITLAVVVVGLSLACAGGPTEVDPEVAELVGSLGCEEVVGFDAITKTASGLDGVVCIVPPGFRADQTMCDRIARMWVQEVLPREDFGVIVTHRDAEPPICHGGYSPGGERAADLRWVD